jgi:hypothetical protein
MFGKNKNHNGEQLDIEKKLFDRELELYRKEKYQMKILKTKNLKGLKR